MVFLGDVGNMVSSSRCSIVDHAGNVVMRGQFTPQLPAFWRLQLSWPTVPIRMDRADHSSATKSAIDESLIDYAFDVI